MPSVFSFVGAITVALVAFALVLGLIVLCLTLIDRAIYRFWSVLGFSLSFRDFFMVRCWLEDKGIGEPMLYRRFLQSEDYGFSLLKRGKPKRITRLTDRQWETFVAEAFAYEQRQREKALHDKSTVEHGSESRALVNDQGDSAA